MSPPQRQPTAAILLSTDSFELFFCRKLGMSPEDLVRWEGGWSASYCRMLESHGFRALQYVASAHHEGLRKDAATVRFLKLRSFWRPLEHLHIARRSGTARYATQLLNTTALWRALNAALASDEVDVLFIQEYWTARFDVLTAKLGLPIVAVDQGLSGRREIALFKQRALRRARAIVTMTDDEAAQLLRAGANATRIANGVQTEFWLPQDPRRSAGGDRIVLNVAQLSDAHKRNSDLIRALPLLPREWRLQLLGAGRDRPLLERLANELGMTHRVEFLGMTLDRAEVRRRLQAAAVFVLPSAREGLPMALLEAMSCGKPVVASAIPANAGVVTDGVDGLLVPVGDPQAIARAVQRAYLERDHLGRAARATVESSYSERVRGEQLAALAHQILDDGHGSDRAPSTPARASGVGGR
jgi:glycosyltransferase involved in cell wall biosynthesis